MIRNQRFSRPPISIFHFDRRFFLRILVFSTVWFVLTGSDTSSWIVGIPAVLFASKLSLTLTPSSQYRISLAGTVRFIPYFLYQSFHGGIDVMRRAISLQQLLNPGLISYTTILPEGSARIFFVNTISLLPGTLSAELYNNVITIHTLDRDLPIWANIQKLEYHVAALLHIPPNTKNLL